MSRKSRERRKQQCQEFNCDWQVFKVQRPLGGEMSFMLVYNEDRSRTAKVTAGCINVSNEVFDYLVACCSDQELIVHP